MSRLDELIQEYCPDGVDYKPLKDLASIDIGKFVRSDKQGDEKPYPVFNGGRRNTGMYDEYNHDGDYILISARGANAGYTNYFSGKYWAGNSCYSVAINPSIINYRFAYYVIKNSEQAFLGKQQTGSIPAVSKVQVSNLLIPVPPFPVQEEIVRILDTFTELTAELTAELAARKKQYEYYRDNLLLHNSHSKEVKLGEVATIGDGLHSTPKYDDNGSYYFINGNNIKNGALYLTSNTKRCSESEYSKHKKYIPKSTVMMSINGTIGSVGIYNNEPIILGKSIAYFITTEQLSDKFLYHYLQTSKSSTYFRNHVTGSTIKNLGLKALRDFQIYLPPIIDQKSIIQKLDNFETICNNIYTGLPAEIEARQKQYEYYRDKLLTFKELK